MYTKQHFESFAKLIKNSESNSKTEFIYEIVKLFSQDNQKFNRAKFLRVSGISNSLQKTELINSFPESKNLRIIPQETSGYSLS